MKTATVLVAATLLAGPAHAQQPPPNADVQGTEAEKGKGYGYGTPSGVEARDGSAGQAVDAKPKKKGKRAKKRAKAPQQEESTTSSKGAPASNAAAPQGAQEHGSYKQGGQAPAR